VTASPTSASSPSGFGRTFQALTLPAYRVLWFGTLFSFIGMQMQVVARGYLAFDLTGSNTALGGVMISFGIPQLVFGLWGGVVADRMAKRRVLMVWQTVIALASAAIAVAIFTGRLEYWMLLASGVLTGTSFAFIGPARQAFIGDLVPPGLMGNAIVLQQANMNGTRVFGPALAGALIALPLIGSGGVYALTTLGFVIATTSMARLPLGAPKRTRDGRSAIADILDGLAYVRAHRSVGILISMSFLVVALGFPYQGFLASVTRDEFEQGAVGLGLLSSAAAVGALVATLVVASLTGHRHAWRIQMLAGVGFGAALVVFGASPNFVFGLGAALFVGAAASAFQSLNNALTITLTEPRYFGRVQALLGISWSLFGIVSLPLGLLADAIGIRETLMLMGVASIASVVGLELLGRLRGAEADMQRRRVARAGGPERQSVPAPAVVPPVVDDGGRPSPARGRPSA
jgi:MFS family permease